MNTPRMTASLLLRALRIGALALLVGAALLPNLARLAQLLRLPPANVDEMAQRDRRFESLRDVLPQRAVVGYVSDARDPTELQIRLMLAQFSLAPVIVVSGTQRVPIVGDFSNPDSIGRGLDPELTILRDFGNGVVLLGRAQR